MLDENRFLAARDGMDAQLIDPRRDRWRAGRASRLAELVDACAPHARELGCEGELAEVASAWPPRRAPRVSASWPAAPAASKGSSRALAGEFI